MGILSGYKMVEFAGIGPAPMAAMLLSDMGAEILRIDRIEDPNLGIQTDFKYDLLTRGRRSIAIDLKHPKSTEAVLKLIGQRISPPLDLDSIILKQQLLAVVPQAFQ